MFYLTELKSEDRSAFNLPNNPPKKLTKKGTNQLAEPAPNYFIILLIL